MQNDNQNILLSFIIGAAAGITAGLLLAPETGEETRKAITKKASSLKDQVGSQLNTTMGKVNDTIGKLKKGGSKSATTPSSTSTASTPDAKKAKKPGTTSTGAGSNPTV